jgi:hypothetical protein
LATGDGAALPAAARAGRVLLRANADYFAGALARTALFADVQFAIGTKRIAPLWRILSGAAEDDWVDAIDMHGAQVAVAAWCPDWSMSLMESAPATIPATSVTIFAVAFAPPFAATWTRSVSSVASPHRTASASTAASPAHDTRFGSSNRTDTARRA